MALTDRKTINKMIQVVEVFIPSVEDEKIKLPLFDKAQLVHRSIVPGSEIIKIKKQFDVSADSSNPLTLNDQDPFNLNATKIVRDSVYVTDAVVAPVTLFIENADYIIDYNIGTIERTTIKSSIVNGSQVYVFYVPYEVLNVGNDYNIDYNTGEINRRAGSTIPNKATVYADYTHAQNTPSDAAIDECIIEMEYEIQPKLKSGYSLESPDRGLKAAATNYVLSLICLSQAFRELTMAEHKDASKLSIQWGNLSDKYRERAATLFSPFLKTSMFVTGGIIQNRWAKSRNRTQTSPSVSPSVRRH